MPKYLVQATYTSEGLKGLQKDKASGRRAAIAAAVEAMGGKLEVTYYCFGDYDVMVSGRCNVPYNGDVGKARMEGHQLVMF